MHKRATFLGLSALAAGCAGSDGGVAADARVDPFCIGRPQLTFCEDFDDRELPGAFAEPVRSAGATIAIDSDPSAPSSARSVTFRLQAGASESAFLRTARQAPSTQAAVFFYVRVDAFGADLDLALLEDVSGHRIALQVARDGTLRLASDSIHESSIKLVAGAWTAVRWDVRFVDGVLAARLRIGSATAFSSEPLGLKGATIEPRFAIGAARADGPAMRVSFDSVTFEGPES